MAGACWKAGKYGVCVGGGGAFSISFCEESLLTKSSTKSRIHRKSMASRCS